MEQCQCPIFAVSGIKNSGKTTFLEHLTVAHRTWIACGGHQT